MKLSLFREKLVCEIKEAEVYLKDENGYLNQRIQVHIYCISALLRKIMSRIDNADQTYRVKAFEVGADRSVRCETDISLKWLTSRILHYVEFLPSHRDYLYDGEKTITVLSDHDDNLSSRCINLKEFIGVAKQIAICDEAMVDGLLRHVKNQLGEVIHSDKDKPLVHEDLKESLVDVFEIIRKLNRENWINGTITLFRTKYKSMHEPPDLTTTEIGYDVLFKELFIHWHYVPFRQFQPYADDDLGLQLQGKRVIEVDRPASIRLEDLLTLLHAMEQRFCHEQVKPSNHCRISN